MTTVQIPRRAEIVASLRARDGDMCQYPDCNSHIDFTLKDGPFEATIDHWMPQWWGRQEGWTEDEIWDLSNLKLMHKRCNAKKGDAIPNEDGTLPERPMSKFRYRRDKRATRAGLCEVCNNGHNLAMDEVCSSCGGNAQAFPRWAKMKANECDHAAFWCWACSIGGIPRPSAVGMALVQGESGEWGE